MCSISNRTDTLLEVSVKLRPFWDVLLAHDYLIHSSISSITIFYITRTIVEHSKIISLITSTVVLINVKCKKKRDDYQPKHCSQYSGTLRVALFWPIGSIASSISNNTTRFTIYSKYTSQEHIYLKHIRWIVISSQ